MPQAYTMTAFAFLQAQLDRRGLVMWASAGAQIIEAPRGVPPFTIARKGR